MCLITTASITGRLHRCAGAFNAFVSRDTWVQPDENNVYSVMVFFCALLQAALPRMGVSVTPTRMDPKLFIYSDGLGRVTLKSASPAGTTSSSPAVVPATLIGAAKATMSPSPRDAYATPTVQAIPRASAPVQQTVTPPVSTSNFKEAPTTLTGVPIRPALTNTSGKSTVITSPTVSTMGTMWPTPAVTATSSVDEVVGSLASTAETTAPLVFPDSVTLEERESLILAFGEALTEESWRLETSTLVNCSEVFDSPLFE